MPSVHEFRNCLSALVAFPVSRLGPSHGLHPVPGHRVFSVSPAWSIPGVWILLSRQQVCGGLGPSPCATPCSESCFDLSSGLAGTPEVVAWPFPPSDQEGPGSQ